MNNVPQKNIIFENSRNNGLPYYDAGSIRYVGGQNINFATLNNTFQQLIDNDLYAENYIKNYAEHAIGPKSASPSAVYAGVEGYKAFSDDGVRMHIYRKHEIPLSSSVQCVLPDVHANFIAQFGQYVMAGCDDGIYFENNGFRRLADSIPAYGKYFSDYVNLVASDDGVYSMITRPGYDIDQYHLFVKVNANDIGVCRSVYYIDKTHTIVVGTDSGIYEGKCYSYMLGREDVSRSVVFANMKMLSGIYDVCPVVNDITAQDSTPIAATSKGLFKPDQIYDFSGYGSVLSGHDIRYRLDDGKKWIIGADDGIYSVAYDYGGRLGKFIDLHGSIAGVFAGNNFYFATPNGIFMYRENQLNTLATGFDEINSLQVYESNVGNFPIFAEGSAIYYMGSDSDYAELATFENALVNDIFVANHELIAATTAGIYKYRLYVENAFYDSDRILSSDQAYNAVVDEDFGPNGLITVNGNLYAYSGKGIKGLDSPTEFVAISADHCCTFQLEDKSTAIVVASGKDVYVFDGQLQLQTRIGMLEAVEDVKATDNMVIFKLADKTLWQIHKKKIFTLSPEPTQITAYAKVDDFTTYGTYAAVRQDTALKFLQERVKPKQLDKFIGQNVTGLAYNEFFGLVFVSTKYGLFAVDMSKYPYAEQQVYSGGTYGCWTSQNKLYCFVPRGVDVYDIIKTSAPKDDSAQEYEDVLSCVLRHTLMDGQNKIVNGMCELDGRQLYATTDGLYASKADETYENLVSWPVDILFCRKISMTPQDRFICYDNNGRLFWYSGGESRVIETFNDLSITGFVQSKYGDDCFYLATSTSGLYMYDAPADELIRCDSMPSGSSIVGIANVKYNMDGASRIFVACVSNVGYSEGISNKIFVEIDKNVFQEIAIDPSIIASDSHDQLVRVEGVSVDGINSAKLFIYMKAGETVQDRREIKVVPILNTGEIAAECEISAVVDVDYDNIYASSDRIVYMTRRTATGLQTYIYAVDGQGGYEDRISVVTDIDEIFKDSRMNIYARKGGEYYRLFVDRTEKLLVSDSIYGDRILGLNYFDKFTGYITVTADRNGQGGGVYQIQPIYTTVVPVKTDFANRRVYSIQNAFGLIIISYNNKIYWSDAEHVEELADTSNYHELLPQKGHFTGFCVSEDMHTAHAYGTKFMYSWDATSRNSLIANANNYMVETYDDLDNFSIEKIIPHESYVIDMYLGNRVDYDKPYFLPGNGIYVYDLDNVSMLAKPSRLKTATKLFQAPDGLVYMAQFGVMRTTNCETEERMEINGTVLSDRVSGIKHDGENYYVNIGGRWYYVYNKVFVQVPDAGEIVDIRRSQAGTVYVKDGKFFKFAYAKMLHMIAEAGEHALDEYSIRRIFFYDRAPYYVINAGEDVQLLDQNYSSIRIYFEGRTGSSTFENVCLARSGGLILVQIDGSTYFCENFDQPFKKYDVPELVFPVNAYVKNEYTGFDSAVGITRFNKYGIVNVYRQVDDIPVCFTKILEIGENDYFICSGEGLYRYVQGIVYKMSGETIPALGAYSDMFEDAPGYVVSNGSDILRSGDFVDWRFLFDIGVSGEIKDIYVKSLNDYYVATTAGVVKTVYSYELINDIEQRDEYELQEVVDSLAGDLDSTFENQLDDHLLKWHSKESQMNFVNREFLSVDMSGISEEWQRINSNGDEFIVENDLVDVMETGDLSELGCEVSTENPVFSQRLAPAEYVLKRYTSGVAELLIHVQTTKTYYLNGVPGSPVPRNEQEAVSRKNLESMPDLETSKKKQNSSVSEHATKITLTIPKAAVGIQEVHDVQISPCSLPLKIYSENVDSNDLEKNGIFNSKVIPSIALPYDIDSDNATFNFRCFGTDEQSIRIQFTETENYAANGFVTVEFYPNGGDGTMTVQRVPIDTQAKLRKSQFTSDSEFFAGWSFVPVSSGGEPEYSDGEQVVFSSGEYSNGDTVKLYAVWTSQDIQNDVNIFGIVSDGTPVYVKDAVEIYPGQTLIDYGDGSEKQDPQDDSWEEQYSGGDPEEDIDEELERDDSVDIGDYQSIIDGINPIDLNDNSITG